MINFIRYGLPRGIKNLVFFFPVVWRYRNYDYSYSLALFRQGLIGLRKCLEDGMEIERERLPKVFLIDKAIDILEHVEKDNYLELSEISLNMEYYCAENWSIELDKTVESKNSIISKHSRKLQEKEWKELKKILFGNKKLQGSDIRGWWD